MNKAADKEKFIRNYLFTEKGKTLIRLFAGDSFTKPDAELLTDQLDADQESVVYMLSLGILGFMQGWDYFPSSLVPRLKGLHRYYQVRNSAAAPWFQTQLSILNKADIPALLTGGTAMRTFYASDKPRLMNGYDVTVPSKDYDKALELLRDSVKKADPAELKDRTINGLSVIRLHKGIPHPKLTDEEELWKYSIKTTYLNQEVLIPSAEDMLLYLFCVPYGPWVMQEDHPDRCRRLCESCLVLTRGIDYKRLIDMAKRIGQENVVCFYLKTLSELSLGMIPESSVSLLTNQKTYGSYLDALADLCQTTQDISRHAEKASGRLTALSDKTKLHFARKKLLNVIEKA